MEKRKDEEALEDHKLSDDIKKILSERFMKDERIRDAWVCDRWDGIVSTQHRLFFIKESTLEKSYVEVPYSHITSLHYGKVRDLRNMILAVLLWVVSILIYFYREHLIWLLSLSTQDYAVVIVNSIIGLLAVSGAVLAIIFAFGRTWFTIHINGRDPMRLTKDLVELWGYIREGEPQDPFAVKPG